MAGRMKVVRLAFKHKNGWGWFVDGICPAGHFGVNFRDECDVLYIEGKYLCRLDWARQIH